MYLSTVALIASGTAFAQSGFVPTPIIDSYTAGLLECECSIDHPDGHGVPARVRKSDEMRAKAWEPANTVVDTDTARTVRETTPGAMAANEGRRLKENRSRPSGSPAGAK